VRAYSLFELLVGLCPSHVLLIINLDYKSYPPVWAPALDFSVRAVSVCGFIVIQQRVYIALRDNAQVRIVLADDDGFDQTIKFGCTAHCFLQMLELCYSQ
jgi:hypothetical protein